MSVLSFFCRHSGESRNPALSLDVIPAKAGIQRLSLAVIPAKAGIHFAFRSNKTDQYGFPLSRE
jgi:hypothetical protein